MSNENIEDREQFNEDRKTTDDEKTITTTPYYINRTAREFAVWIKAFASTNLLLEFVPR